MATSPKHTSKHIVRHEWAIGSDSDEFSYADALRDGIRFAQIEMENLGVDLETGDAFKWRAGDGGQIVLYVDIEGPESVR